MTGSITYGDLRAVAPFPNTVDIVRITGDTLRRMLEFSVAEYDPSALEPFGGFLQVSGILATKNSFYYTTPDSYNIFANIIVTNSGIHVTFDVSRPKGDRVVELMARCNECRIPNYLPVEPEVS